MANTSIELRILAQLHSMSLDRQSEVLRFARDLAETHPQGVAGRELLRFAGTIEVEDARTMERVIADGCEQVHVDDW